MIELEFHCCHCGEENVQLEKIDEKYSTESFITRCNYCEKLLNITVERKYEVTWIE